MTEQHEQSHHIVNAINEYVEALERDLKAMNKGSYRYLGVKARKLERTIYHQLGVKPAPNKESKYSRVRYTDNPTK